MPSVFVLEGPRNIGAIAVPLNRGRGGYPEYGGRGPNLMGAVALGFGEVSPAAKNTLIALGALAVIGLVFYHGGEAARRRGLRGARRRRRRR